MTPPLTGAVLRAAQLGRPGWGRKGYETGQVDSFLARAADALDAVAGGRTPDLTADDVHQVVFSKQGFGRGRGYDEDEVDALLDQVESVLGGRPATGVELNGRPLGE